MTVQDAPYCGVVEADPRPRENGANGSRSVPGVASAMRVGRRSLFKASVAAGSILASLALAEGLVRIFYPHVRDGVVPGRLFEIDQSLGWKLRPGASSVHASRYFRAEYAINDLGFRDGGRRLEKGDDVAHRVLLYGDSQAFGWGVPTQRRFSNLVEARLPGLEIWNLAVPGYGLDQELLSYEQSGDRFDADEALLLITVATLSRLPYGNIYRKNKPRFDLDSAGSARLVPIRGGANALVRLSYETLSVFSLPYFVERRLAAARRAVGGGRDKGGASGAAPAVELGDLELAILERARAKALAADHLLTLLVALPPSWEPAKRSLESFASARGIGYLEIVVPSEEGYVFGPEDHHWNERANALIADQVAAALGPRRGSTSG